VLTTAFLGLTLRSSSSAYTPEPSWSPWDLLPSATSSPALVECRLGFRDLTVWSFLMASAHAPVDGGDRCCLGSNTVKAHGRMVGYNYISPTRQSLGDARHRCPYGCLSCGHRTARLGSLSKLGLALYLSVFNFDWSGSGAHGHGLVNPPDIAGYRDLAVHQTQ